jgi:2-keto-3-deoxy-L-rhamnonate aldolase RhmA
MSTVETQQQAEDFRAFCLYRLQRGQGLVRENRWNDQNLESHRDEIDRSLMLIPQIETIEGIENIAKIRHRDFSQYLVGPYDLSASLCKVGQFHTEEYDLAIKELEDKCGDKLTYHFVKNVEKNRNVIERICKHREDHIVAVSMDTIVLSNMRSSLQM